MLRLRIYDRASEAMARARPTWASDSSLLIIIK